MHPWTPTHTHLQIRNVKMITDKNSRRPKGIAYVEFVEIESVANVSIGSNVFVHMCTPTYLVHDVVCTYTNMHTYLCMYTYMYTHTYVIIDVMCTPTHRCAMYLCMYRLMYVSCVYI